MRFTIYSTFVSFKDTKNMIEKLKRAITAIAENSLQHSSRQTFTLFTAFLGLLL